MWSLGVLIGLPVTVLAVLLCLGWIIFWLREGEPGAGLGFGGAGLVAVLAIAAFAYFPYRAEYHQWRPIDGGVKAVSSRLLAQDKAMSQRFVVTFDSGETRSCDDTRCALIQAGDHLWLTCKRHWQYAGEDGYDCNFERVEEAS